MDGSLIITTYSLSIGMLRCVSPPSQLIAYTDANWGGCPDTRRSTFGYCVFLGDNLISWSAKRQPTLSRSSDEAEYRGVANVVVETCWLRNLLLELHIPLRRSTLVFCDNVSAVYLSAIRFSISRLNTLKWTFTSFMKRLLWVIFGYHISRQLTSTSTYSRRAFLVSYSSISETV
ncbi:hypothetical protein L6452_09688 [Arctium lappa]|uniref:Uncharacterized protein n=1 Tax=Arctium lappa TaxID=4217 RepID=A0ACB9DLX3_ARCLA|nr:hypothetical protein L6452_09688 [Arctium lappa]